MNIEITEETNRYDNDKKWRVVETDAKGREISYWCETEAAAIYVKNYRETWNPNNNN